MIDAKVAEFFTGYPRHSAKKGDILLQDHDMHPSIYYVVDGNVAQRDVSSRGDVVELTVYRPGSFFPLLTVFTGHENRFFFVAKEEVVYHKAPAEDVYMFLQKHPDVAMDVTRRLYLGIEGLLMRMTSLLSGDAHDRILTYLKIANTRYNRLKHMPFLYRTTHKDIAQQTGLSRETVTRVLKVCEDEGYIRRHSQGIEMLKKVCEL